MDGKRPHKAQKKAKDAPSPHTDAKNLSGDNLAGRDGVRWWEIDSLLKPGLSEEEGVCPAAPGPPGVPNSSRPRRHSPRKRGPGQPRSSPWPRPPSPGPTSPLSPPGARLWKAVRPRKATQNARPVHPAGLPCARDPSPWGPAPLRLAAVIFRKSEIKDGWRSGPERLGRRSAGGVAQEEKAKTKKEILKGKSCALLSHLFRALQCPPQRGWPATPAPGGGERSRPLPPLGPGGARATARPPPGGLPGVRSLSSLLEKPPRGERKSGDPRGLSFKSGAREGGGEPNLQVGGGY